MELFTLISICLAFCCVIGCVGLMTAKHREKKERATISQTFVELRTIGSNKVDAIVNKEELPALCSFLIAHSIIADSVQLTERDPIELFATMRDTHVLKSISEKIDVALKNGTPYLGYTFTYHSANPKA